MAVGEPSVIDQIFASYKDLYDAEKKVADYVVANQDKVIDMTVSQLSAASEASEATIIRFCKKCGCKGFHHLKIQMAKETIEQSEVNVTNELDINNLRQSLNNILANKVEELKQTMSQMDENQLKDILNAILNSRIVQFAAVGNTIPIALDGAYKFNQIGISSVASTIWENQLAFAHTLDKNDVVIAISASGASKNLLTMVDMANNRGATVISITNHSQSTLSMKSKYHINTATRERLFIDEFSFTRLAAMAVIEALFLLLITSKRDSYNCLTDHEQAIAEDKL